jgi:hypothetical protein
MTARLDSAAERSTPDGSGPGVVAWYAEGFRDAIGDRLLLFDSKGPGLELLRVRGDLALAEGFEALLRARIEALRHFRHAAFAPVRAIKWLDDPQPRLAVVSDHAPGERLSRVLRVARSRGLRPGADAVLWLLRALMPGVAALHEHQGIAHGLLTADRIVVTPDGAILIADYVFASALERQRLAPFELWERFGVAIMPGRAGAGLSRRADIEQVARLAISMLSDRVDVTTPGPLPPAELLAHVRSQLAQGPDRRLGDWLARALGVEEPAFETAREAQYALDGMLPRRAGTWAPWLLPSADVEAAVGAARPALPAPEDEEDTDDDELGATVLMSREELDAMSAMARAAAAAAATPPQPPRPAWQRALPNVAVVAASVAVVEGGLLLREWRREAARASITRQAEPASDTPTPPTSRTAPRTPSGSQARGERGAPTSAPLSAAGTSGQGTTRSSERSLASGTGGAATRPIRPAAGVVGWVSVKARVDVRVYANGRFLGTSTDETYKLPEGTHEIRLVNDQAGIDERRYIRIVPGQTVTISPKYSESRGSRGSRGSAGSAGSPGSTPEP